MTTRSTVAVAALSAAGLLVSLGAAVPRLVPGPEVQEARPGLAAVRVGEAGERAGTPPARSSEGARSQALSTQVGRRDAVIPAAQARGRRVVPVRLEMRSVDLALPVRPVGVADDGQMALPPDPAVLGWYEFGPAPAERSPGSAVLAGHLDSRRFGLGPLVRLREVRVGDAVEVTASGGSVTSYTVVSVRRFDRQALPAAVFSRAGRPRLRIVTCGGGYDEKRGYLQNLVVTAVPR